MPRKSVLFLAGVGLLALLPVTAPVGAQQEKPVVKIPEPGVPQIMTMEGRFIRASYNNEAYAILGYQVANLSIGEEWMLLDFGTTMLKGDYTLRREHLSLDTPDAQGIALPSVQEYRAANLQALEARARVQRDSINYFPPMATQPCRIGFFAELSQRAMPWDQVELTDRRACVGRLFFKVPGGIKYGQHWLNVQYENSQLRVPFRILTKEEEKMLSKNYKSISKQVKEAFKPKKQS